MSCILSIKLKALTLHKIINYFFPLIAVLVSYFEVVFHKNWSRFSKHKLSFLAQIIEMGLLIELNILSIACM